MIKRLQASTGLLSKLVVPINVLDNTTGIYYWIQIVGYCLISSPTTYIEIFPPIPSSKRECLSLTWNEDSGKTAIFRLV